MELKTLLFNLQDFYLFLDKGKNIKVDELTEIKWQILSPSIFPNKSLEKTFAFATLIQDRSPDILMLVEVGGKESLDNFNQYFLNQEYEVYHAPSNSDRGIDMGYLVKKSLLREYQFRFKAHTKMKLNNGKLPSRGFLQLNILKQDEIILTFLLTHLKSKLDLKKVDFEGRGQRAAEVAFLTKFYNKHKNQCPIIIAGDFNGIITDEKETEPELLPLITNCDLIDVLGWQNHPPEQRATYYYFTSRGKTPMQLDYILVPRSHADNLCKLGSAKVIDTTYLSSLGKGEVSSLEQRNRLISDHFPVEVVLKLKD